MEQLSDTVWLHSTVTHGFTVTCGVVMARDRIFVFDTLDSPQAVEPVAMLLEGLAAGRRIVVVNSHHHWDHVYGNAAFAGHDVVAHRLCRRLVVAQMDSGSESVPAPPPEGVPLPSIGFGDRLRFEDEDAIVNLIHTPGHTEDSIILYIPDQQVLLGGDTVEWPFPSLAQRDGRGVYTKTLRQLNQLAVRQVVPSHGPAMGKEIIDANQRYIEELYEAVRARKRSGARRVDIDLPVEAFVGKGVEIDATYRVMHRENVEWAYDDV
jgi:glyoxylase-like metal-dependent hydrolase (beta-lactamase superfamily II)